MSSITVVTVGTVRSEGTAAGGDLTLGIIARHAPWANDLNAVFVMSVPVFHRAKRMFGRHVC